MLENIVIILQRPQESLNIGAVMRAMRNMGLQQLRLVAPEQFDAAAILRVAHRCDEILASTAQFATLDAALQDLHYVVGTAARRHPGRPLHEDPRALAPALLQRAASGLIGFLFGPEDDGLDQAALDRCNLLVRIPTAEDYPALNLAQAALLLMYELRMASLLDVPHTTARRIPAPAGELQQFFDSAEQALWSIEFFKSGRPARSMRRLRRLILRAEPDHEELALLSAIAREIPAFLRRK